MASESPVTDQSIHEKVGDNTKEKEHHEPEDVSIDDGNKKEEEHGRVGEKENSLQESQVSNSSELAHETNGGKSDDVVEISTSIDPVNSELKHEDLKDPEAVQTSQNESKSEEAPFISTIEAETPEAIKPDSSKGKVDIELINSEDTKDEVQELVHAEVPTVVTLGTSERLEDNDVDEQKPEGSAEPILDTELIKAEDVKGEVQDLVPSKDPSYSSETPEKNNVDLITSTSIEEPVKSIQQPEKIPNVDFGSDEIKYIEAEDSKQEVLELVPTVLSINASAVSEQNDVDSSAPTTIEIPLKDLEAESGDPEEQKSEGSAETKADIKLVKSEDLKDESQELVPAEISTSTSEAPEKKDVDSSTSSSMEVPVKDLEVESGSPEEEKSSVTEEPISNATTIDGGGEVAGSPSYEAKSSRVAEVVEKKDEDFKEEVKQTAAMLSEDQTRSDVTEVVERNNEGFKEDVIQTTPELPEDLEVRTELDQTWSDISEVEKKDEGSKEELIQTMDKLPEDLKAITEVDQTKPDEDKFSQAVAANEVDRTLEGGLETSTVLDVPLVPKLSSEDKKVSEPEVFQERNDEVYKGDNINTVPEVSEVSLEGNVLDEDISVGKEKYVNVEATERGLPEISMEPIVVEVSTEQVKALENVEEPLEATSKEPNVSPESSEVPSTGEGVSASYLKRESLKVEDSTLVETSKDIAISDESLDQLIEEKKNASSKNETDASVEHSLEEVKDIIASETVKEKKEDETFEDPNLERKINVPEDSEEKGKETIEKVAEKPELVVLGDEKKETEKPKDQDPLVPSDTVNVKLIKEATKSESNLFAKVKRSIIKAKRAILGKSPDPKAVSSEAKGGSI